MAPFGNTSMSNNDFNDVNFFDSLPPLDSRKGPDCSSFFPEPLDVEDKRIYCLALIDEASGEVIRPATEADLLKLLEDAVETKQETKEDPEAEARQCSDAYFKELLSKGPVCRHCGVTESPQWRRGPPTKPILCNACGTRFRRTGQLNHAAQNASRKRVTPSDCAREMVGEKSRVMKQPRVVS